MPSFCGLFVPELEKILAQCGQPPYRVKQLLHWVYQKNALCGEKMTNIGQAALSSFEKLCPLSVLKRVQVEESKDGETTKFLWALEDNKYVESVLIRSGQRRTVCVSSQVGCNARCSFCASGQKGLIRHLTAGEIVEQVVRVQQALQDKQERVSHLVFMGMGEPLDNIDAVLRAIFILTDPLLGGFSQRRITLSTVGRIEGIERLIREDIRVNLALSLHAPNQKTREKIVPYARQNPLSDLLNTVRGYAAATKRDMTYEYVLLAGINDRIEDAKELGHLLRKDQCCVNLIPYNPVPNRRLKRPTKEAIAAFRKELFAAGVNNTCRYTKGKDIAAACGQLALQESGRISGRDGLKKAFSN